MENNVFNDLPLLLAVPRAAQLLGSAAPRPTASWPPANCPFADSAGASTS
jgi:hypothetical protein